MEIPAEADFQLMYCSTGTFVPLSTQAWQERITAQEADWLAPEEQEVML
jgi:hypothetical protein